MHYCINTEMISVDKNVNIFTKSSEYSDIGLTQINILIDPEPSKKLLNK